MTDETGLDGAYDYRQQEADEGTPHGDNSDSFMRMISRAGLRFEKRQGPVETLVIESAAKPAN